MTLKEWFKDRHLYHLVGYLINEDTPISEIRKAAIGANKREFRERLRKMIFRNLFAGNIVDFERNVALRAHLAQKMENWEYPDAKIRSALLLFNIASLLMNSASNQRFQFDTYKKDSWDIEHIRSVKSEKPDRVDEQKKWLENVLEYYTGFTEKEIQKGIFCEVSSADGHLLRDRIQSLLTSVPFRKPEFDTLYNEVLQACNEADDGDVDNTIGNLALLDSWTNRSYQNAIFPIKRKRILDLDKSGAFVPICTKHVFLKYYSKKIYQMMVWNTDDRDIYQLAIQDTLFEFFKREKGVSHDL